MIGFAVKKIPPKLTVGEKLKKIREENFYTTKRLAKRLLIHEKYVKAIEAGDYDYLPGEMYTKNFIGSYAKFFKKNSVPFLNQYLEEIKEKRTIYIKTNLEKSSTKPLVFWGANNLVRNLAISLIIIIFISYIGFEIKKIVTPPELIVYAPQDEQVIRKPTIKIIGKTEKEAKLKINGTIIMPRLDGTFEEEIDLQRGLNIIKISSAKKYSKEKILYRKIIFEEVVALK